MMANSNEGDMAIRVTALQRERYLFYIVGLGFPIAVLQGGLVAVSAAGLSLVGLGLLTLMMLFVAGGMWTWWRLTVSGLRRRLRRSDGALCPRCAYDLRDRADTERCTECGLRVTTPEAKHAWRVWSARNGSLKHKVKVLSEAQPGRAPSDGAIPITVFRRQTVVFVLLMAGGPIVIWGGGALAIWLLNMPWIRMTWLWAIAGPLQVGAMIWWFRAVSRLSKRVRETDGLLCPNCGYDLRDRGDPEQCSECGLRVTDERAVQAWRHWRRVKRKYDRDVVRARRDEEARKQSD